MSPGSNPLCYRFEDCAFSFSSLSPLSTQLYKCHMSIDSGGNVSDLFFTRNFFMARMLPGEAELGSE